MRDDAEAAQSAKWNFDGVSVDELLELRHLIKCDTDAATVMQNKLIHQGKLSYAYQKPY